MRESAERKGKMNDKTTHTPGPWMVQSVPNTRGMFGVVADTIHSEILQADSYYTRMQTICELPADVTPAVPGVSPAAYKIAEHHAANAALIASAPDMIALLERAVADRIDDAWLTTARALIAKAKRR